MVLFLFISCGTSIKSEKELLKWINNPKNGLVKRSTVNNFTLTMKYMPPAYLAFNEMVKDGHDKPEKFKEYLEIFKRSRTFLMSIENKTGSDASTYDVYTMGDYKQRIEQLNFNMKKAFVLKTSSKKEFSPVLTTLENLYEIGNKKLIYMVFSDAENEILESETIDIRFEDTFLDTGISHFLFQTENLDKLPKLTFVNN